MCVFQQALQRLTDAAEKAHMVMHQKVCTNVYQ
jgi:hypothetical protein